MSITPIFCSNGLNIFKNIRWKRWHISQHLFTAVFSSGHYCMLCDLQNLSLESIVQAIVSFPNAMLAKKKGRFNLLCIHDILINWF